MSFRLSLLAAATLGGVVLSIATPGLAVAQTAGSDTTVNSDGGFFGRLYQAYADEWGKPPADPAPGSPPIRRAPPFPPQPENSPPYPFTEWPFGGSSAIGATVPAMVDSPLMTALAPTAYGKWLIDNGIQTYGWINPGGNISTSTTRKNGNFPAAYAYDPNTAWLDQAVLIIERTPDMVQQDHIDWGFRLSPLFGETYRYTTAFGLWSYQLQKKNQQNGFDVPMAYGELYVPGILEGLNFRLGRYISVPDTEAQLAPNNYMYSHSMTYAYDNYTNTGLLTTLQATKNLMLQFAVTTGTDTMPWNKGTPSYLPNGYQAGGVKDPGTQPSFTGCIRYQTDSSNDAIYSCANALNNGTYGYNNLQQYTTTFYHKFDDKWHITYEIWDMHENHAPNANYTGSTPTPYPFANLLNGPFLAQCGAARSSCRAEEYAMVSYLNYQITPLDNISLRGEFFNDQNGQRTGVKTRYLNSALGWQHWFSPTITLRPEIAQYSSLDAKAFNRNPGAISATNLSGAKKSTEIIGSMDLIFHY